MPGCAQERAELQQESRHFSYFGFEGSRGPLRWMHEVSSGGGGSAVAGATMICCMGRSRATSQHASSPASPSSSERMLFLPVLPAPVGQGLPPQPGGAAGPAGGAARFPHGSRGGAGGRAGVGWGCDCWRGPLAACRWLPALHLSPGAMDAWLPALHCTGDLGAALGSHLAPHARCPYGCCRRRGGTTARPPAGSTAPQCWRRCHTGKGRASFQQTAGQCRCCLKLGSCAAWPCSTPHHSATAPLAGAPPSVPSLQLAQPP